MAIAGTGSGSGVEVGSTDAARIRDSDIVSQVDAEVAGDQNVIAGAVPGGLFLDQEALAREGISGDAVVQSMLQVTAPDGARVFDDAFQGFAVSFGRYC